MNILKKTAATLVAFGLAGLASAQTNPPAAASVVINFVGSTAMRTAVTEAEYSVLAGGGTVWGAYNSNDPGATAWTSGTGPGGSTFVSKSYHSALIGTMTIGGVATEVEFRNFWTGSLAGVVDLTQGGTPDNFIPAGDFGSFTVVSTTGGAIDNTTEAGAANVAMSDCQASDAASVLAGAPGVGPSYASAITAAIQASTLTDGGTTGDASNKTVGLVTFQWVAGNASGGTPFTNITTDQAQTLIHQGWMPLSAFTGQTTDNKNFVIFIGRNEDSGTRILYDANSVGGGLGTAQAFGPQTNQYMIQQNTSATGYSNGFPSTNTVATVAAAIEGFQAWPKTWPLNTEPLNWNAIGHSGYTGGPDVANMLLSSNPTTFPTSTAGDGHIGAANAPTGFVANSSKIYFVSCLGTSDAKTAVTSTSGATYLSYNGVTFSSLSGSSYSYATSAIAAGQYSAWNYEHLYYLTGSASNAVSSSQQPMADAVADLIYQTATTALVPAAMNYTDLVVSRSQTAGSLVQ